MHMKNTPLFQITEKILKNKQASLSFNEAMTLAQVSGDEIIDLFTCAHKITSFYMPDEIFTCTIINAKSGHCSQDCAFCAQSSHHTTGIMTYPLLSEDEMVANAMEMEKTGATNFSMVTSGPKLSDSEIETICRAASRIKSKTNLTVCSSLGMLTRPQAQALKKNGITHYHHNLETAESFFDQICTTHDFSEDVDTIKMAAEAGLSVCSGCLFGLGESWKHRVELALTLKELNVKRIPINFLNPIPGTKLEHRQPLSPMDALKCIALFRFLTPLADITICGGREPTLRDYQSWIFMAGANGVMIGNNLFEFIPLDLFFDLTTRGRDIQMDLDMIDSWQMLHNL